MKKIYFIVLLVLLLLNIFWIFKYSKLNHHLKNEIIHFHQINDSNKLLISNLKALLKSTYIKEFKKDWNEITDKIIRGKIVLFI